MSDLNNESIVADDSQTFMSEDDLINSLVDSYNTDVQEEPSNEEVNDEALVETDEVEETESEEEVETTESEVDEATDEDEREEAVDVQTELVKVKVGDEEVEVSIDELKRLYGQEKSLTQKSQKLAEERKAFEEQAQTQMAAYTGLATELQKKYQEYASIDWNLAAKKLTEEEYTALREDAQQVQKQFSMVTQNAQQLKQAMAQKAQQAKLEEAKQAYEFLSSDQGIEGWSKDKYNELVEYAVESGFKKEQVVNTTNPMFFKMLHQAQQATKAQKVAIEKKNKTPKKVVKSTGKPKVDRQDKAKKAMNRLANSGNDDDAVAALMSRWG